jgi:putative PIG3 family NAD(P)H quinone oxidoreductase
MKAIEVIGKGEAARLQLGEVAAPELAASEVRIDVVASAVNRADLMQRRGFYPPPPGASATLGLECAGVISEIGEGVSGYRVGDRVAALLPGGGYAEQATAHAGSLISVPPDQSLTDAAGIPEVFLTCSLNLFQLAAAPAGGWALVHGGGSGIGTAAIQLLREAGLRTVVTAGSDEKCARCVELGADLALNYNEGEFAQKVLDATEGRGVDVILDSIGAPYMAQHLTCLATGGRLVLIGLMGGAQTEINLGLLLGKRLTIHGSTLRARPVEEKAEIVKAFLARFGDALAKGTIRPVVDRVLPLSEAQAAHDVLQESSHFGKIILQVSSES